MLDALGSVVMSVTDIIRELPKLTREERSSVLHRLRELEQEDQVLFLHEPTDSMFQEIDKPDQPTGPARQSSHP